MFFLKFLTFRSYQKSIIRTIENSYKSMFLKILETKKKSPVNVLNNVLKNLRDNKEISSEQYKDLSPSGSRPGIMYGLAKVHKIVTDGLPSFRPILSAIGTPTYS